MSLGDITREAVLEAIADYDRLGQDAFLDTYGFARARSYLLIHDGKAYDPMAIAGAAHGFLPGRRPLASGSFSGGEAAAGRKLRKLGFAVQVGEQTAASLASLLSKLNVDRTHGPAALYQPITLLWAISRAGQGEPRLAPWLRTREEIAGLVECYGRPGEGDRIHYPLSALYRACLWDLGPDGVTLPDAREEAWFNEHRPDSGLVPSVYDLLRSSSDARVAAVRALARYFTDAPCDQLLFDLGLSESPAEEVLRQGLAAEYGRLCARADAFWSSKPDRRVSRTSNDPIRSRAARQAVILRSEGHCENPECSGDINDVTDAGKPLLEVDHIHDLALGGEDNPAQMVALCPNCHTIKTHGRTRERLRRELFAVAARRHRDLSADC